MTSSGRTEVDVDFELFRKASMRMTEQENDYSDAAVADLIQRTERHMEQLRRDLVAFETSRRSDGSSLSTDLSRKRPQHDAT
jgi:hypothetical protein